VSALCRHGMPSKRQFAGTNLIIARSLWRPAEPHSRGAPWRLLFEKQLSSPVERLAVAALRYDSNSSFRAWSLFSRLFMYISQNEPEFTPEVASSTPAGVQSAMAEAGYGSSFLRTSVIRWSPSDCIVIPEPHDEHNQKHWGAWDLSKYSGSKRAAAAWTSQALAQLRIAFLHGNSERSGTSWIGTLVSTEVLRTFR
jgi:hypothetical protein